MSDPDVTVLIVANPVGNPRWGYPGTTMIERTLEGLRNLNASFRLVVVLDGLGGERSRRERWEYARYKRRLFDLLPDGSERIELGRRRWSSFAALSGLRRVRSSFVLLLEHDAEIVRPVPTDRILSILTSRGGVRFVRLNRFRNAPNQHDPAMEPVEVDGLRMCRARRWHSQAQIGATETFRRRIAPALAKGRRRMMTICVRAWYARRRRRLGGLFVLGDLGEGAWIHHLDGSGNRDVLRRPEYAEEEVPR